MPVPSCLRKRLLWTVAEAEKLKGSPANSAEIIAVFMMSFTDKINGFITAMLWNIYREDLYYADAEFVAFSMNGPNGTPERKTLELFSEKFRRLYPGYMLDKHMHVVARPETNVINLKMLMSLLKSKDEELW